MGLSMRGVGCPGPCAFNYKQTNYIFTYGMFFDTDTDALDEN